MPIWKKIKKWLIKMGVKALKAILDEEKPAIEEEVAVYVKEKLNVPEDITKKIVGITIDEIVTYLDEHTGD